MGLFGIGKYNREMKDTSKPRIRTSIVAILATVVTLAFWAGRNPTGAAQDFGWDNVPSFSMMSGIKAYWNVGDGSKGETAKKAYSRGFESVRLLNTYSDYPGAQRENISKVIADNHINPWTRPPFFERIVRRNIENAPVEDIYVHDIEIPFEENPDVAWADDSTRLASGTASRDMFEEVYFSKWAEWFSLPLKWTKERYPEARVGLYGVQPFRRDYRGIAGKSAAQIDGTHKSDWRLWKFIDPYVDFYISSIYIFYDRPDSVFYMASNVEENYKRTRSLGDKPVYAYEWLRFHDSNMFLRGTELPPYLVEAMAIVPYFSGAKGIVLWGWEPNVTTGDQQPYQQLPLFVKSLKRVALLSGRIGKGRLLDDLAAHDLWTAHELLVRRIMVNSEECVIMAINPWQDESVKTTQSVQCGQLHGQITLDGRHTMLAVLNRKGIQFY